MYKYYKETMDFVDKLDGLTSDQEKEQLFSEWEQWLLDHSVKSMDWAYLMHMNSFNLFLLSKYENMFDRYTNMVDRYMNMFDRQEKMLCEYKAELDDYRKIFDVVQKLELLRMDTSDTPLQ